MEDTKYKFFRDAKDSAPAKKKNKKTYAERVAEREAKMTPEEIADRKRKMNEQGTYEDGGVVKKKKSYFSKIKSMCKK